LLRALLTPARVVLRALLFGRVALFRSAAWFLCSALVVALLITSSQRPALLALSLFRALALVSPVPVLALLAASAVLFGTLVRKGNNRTCRAWLGRGRAGPILLRWPNGFHTWTAALAGLAVARVEAVIGGIGAFGPALRLVAGFVRASGGGAAGSRVS